MPELFNSKSGLTRIAIRGLDAVASAIATIRLSSVLDSTLIDTVRGVLAETGLEASQLELEISEELIVEKLDGRLHMLRDLVSMGVKLAIDDFGTSRASFAANSFRR